MKTWRCIRQKQQSGKDIEKNQSIQDIFGGWICLELIDFLWDKKIGWGGCSMKHTSRFFPKCSCRRNFVCSFACSLESFLCSRYTIERSKIMEPGYALKLCKLQNFLTGKNVGHLHKYIFIMLDIFRKSLMHQYTS